MTPRERAKIIATITCVCRSRDWQPMTGGYSRSHYGKYDKRKITILYPMKRPGKMFSLVYHHPYCNALSGLQP